MRKRLERALGSKVINLEPVGGGCIAEAYVGTLADGRALFTKTAADRGDVFLSEAEGLREIEASQTIRVPRVFHAEPGLLVLERISVAKHRPPGFFAELGRKLARLHHHESTSFGFSQNNYIGASPQQNLPCVEHTAGRVEGSWPWFYLNYRLIPQFELMRKNDLLTNEAILLFDRLKETIHEVLVDGPPSLLHGDLWSGNYLASDEGEPVLIDPATYYGHREAEFGMTTLFGGLSREFYDAYEKEYPLEAGFKERLPLYQLYHLMNHANLFGRSYLSQVTAILRSYG